MKLSFTKSVETLLSWLLGLLFFLKQHVDSKLEDLGKFTDCNVLGVHDSAPILHETTLLDLELSDLIFVVTLNELPVTSDSGGVGVFVAWETTVLVDVVIDQVGNVLGVLLYLHFEAALDLDHEQLLKDLLYVLSPQAMTKLPGIPDEQLLHFHRASNRYFLIIIQENLDVNCPILDMQRTKRNNSPTIRKLNSIRQLVILRCG